MGGVGGGEARRPENDLVFLVLNLFYSLQRGSNDFITEGDPAFFQEGGPTSSGSGGSKC